MLAHGTARFDFALSDGSGAAIGRATVAEGASGDAGRLSARNALLWLVLLLQIALPSSYYLWRVDREDERFAWRMFSEIRFRSCSVEVIELLPEGERPVMLREALHASWIGALRRGRERVIERFLASRCALPGVTASTLVRSCREVDGQRGAPQRFQYGCATQRLLPSGGPP